jgi:hypothetical protein
MDAIGTPQRLSREFSGFLGKAETVALPKLVKAAVQHTLRRKRRYAWHFG